LTEAIDLIKQKYETELQCVFKDQRYEKVVAFFEFFGQNSFAGQHIEEPHDVLMFDVDLYKKGILPPKEFVELFGHLPIAKLLYAGNANHPFVDCVKTSTLPGMGNEGVVCKAKNLKSNFPSVIMFKIKCNQWIERLKKYCNNDDKLFAQLL
jgi:hypothetical protein